MRQCLSERAQTENSAPAIYRFSARMSRAMSDNIGEGLGLGGGGEKGKSITSVDIVNSYVSVRNGFETTPRR